MKDLFNRVAFWNEDNIGVIVIKNQPLNLIDSDTLNQLSSALTLASSDASLKWIMISGAGDKFFSAGIDWESLGNDYDSISDLVNAVKTFASLMITIDKPVIGVLNGTAAGLGLEIALLTDLLIAPSDVKLCNPEGEIGLPMLLGAPILIKALPRLRAIQLISGEAMSAEEAGRLGLIHVVLPRDNLFGDAKSIILKTRIDKYTRSFIHEDMEHVIKNINPSLLEPLLSKCHGISKNNLASKIGEARNKCLATHPMKQ